MKTSKIYIVLLIWLSLFSSFVSAGEKSDCDFVDSIQQKKVITKYSIIFPQDVFDRSIENLRAYCCDKYADEMEICKTVGSVEDYPHSEFLFDHLLDIAFRRLDGSTGNYVYNLEPDIAWLERRIFINKASLSITWDMAAKIWTEYEKYWKLKHYKYDDTFFSDYNDIEKVSLSDKYYLTCDALKDMINNDMIWRYKLTDKYYDGCKELAYNRISRENVLFRNVAISTSNQLLKSTFNAYLIEYYVQNKISAFKDKLVEFVGVFYTIFKQAPVAKTCSK